MNSLQHHILTFQQIDRTKFELVGGKGANLGELSRISGIDVPEGFCITTQVFKKIVSDNADFRALIKELCVLQSEDLGVIKDLSSRIRKRIEQITTPLELRTEIGLQINALGADNAYAVRSSATAEDLPIASFAGQQDTYLNILGIEPILQHIVRCWASLFSERAVIYRVQNGFDHSKVHLAVVIQKMILPEAAGVMFTADPVTSNRKVLSIDASFGLGESVVSGLVNPDNYRVRDGKIIEKKIAAKKMAIYTVSGGGTFVQNLNSDLQNSQTLNDEQILQLEQIGRTVEKHFGSPQDIEWCLADATIHIVQSRPITTLYPIPQADPDQNHVFISVGHQQMMTDVMKPLGLSFYLLSTRAAMYPAGGRLFVDVAAMLSSPATRDKVINTLGQFDPRIKEALLHIVSRDGFIKMVPPNNGESPEEKRQTSSLDFLALSESDPAVVDQLIDDSQKSLGALKTKIANKSGPELLDCILEDIRESKTNDFYPRSIGVIMAAMNAAMWINENVEKWLGEKSVADTLSQSVSNNITSEMGLQLLDVADVIRPYPEVIAYLREVTDENFLEQLHQFEGGEEARAAIQAYLDRYGMRCAGEIDITRTRWSEKPIAILALILSNIKNFKPNESNRRFDQGRRQALEKEAEIIARLNELPGGELKAEETKRMIDVMRSFSGYREYPKYHMINRYFVYRNALLKEAEELVVAGAIRAKEDIYYLTFEELHELVRTKASNHEIIMRRQQDFLYYQKLSPPRVMTSEGEIVAKSYQQRTLPPKAVAGLGVSSGVIEGRARVIVNMEDAYLQEGDILVTTYTDPSWTPLFVSIKGLVTEVGGVMTHGSVIAREYGIPAVAGVEHATKLIKDGQRIRVNGTDGYVEVI